MLILQLHRSKAALDRDVILLAESGEEGAPDVGAQFMIDSHFDAIDAEFCLAEGGGVVRAGGVVKQANIGTTEKEPRPIELIVTGPAGHGSVPNQNSAVLAVAAAVGRIGSWKPPLRLNETTASYFKQLASMSDAADRAALPRSAQPRSQGARPGRRLDAGERAGPLVDDPHLAGADDHRRPASATTSFPRRPRPPSTCGSIPTRTRTRSSSRCARWSTIPRWRCAGSAIATGRPAARG